MIEHELLHALGFYHEQSRTDRDDYVDILLDEVIPGMCGNVMVHHLISFFIVSNAIKCNIVSLNIPFGPRNDKVE